MLTAHSYSYRCLRHLKNGVPTGDNIADILLNSVAKRVIIFARLVDLRDVSYWCRVGGQLSKALESGKEESCSNHGWCLIHIDEATVWFLELQIIPLSMFVLSFTH